MSRWSRMRHSPPTGRPPCKVRPLGVDLQKAAAALVGVAVMLLVARLGFNIGPSLGPRALLRDGLGEVRSGPEPVPRRAGDVRVRHALRRRVHHAPDIRRGELAHLRSTGDGHGSGRRIRVQNDGAAVAATTEPGTSTGASATVLGIGAASVSAKALSRQIIGGYAILLALGAHPRPSHVWRVVPRPGYAGRQRARQAVSPNAASGGRTAVTHGTHQSHRRGP